MRYSDASNQFLLKTDPLVRGVDRCKKGVDDISGLSYSFKEVAETLLEGLTRAIKTGFRFSTTKFNINNNVKLSGFFVTASELGEGFVNPVLTD